MPLILQSQKADLDIAMFVASETHPSVLVCVGNLPDQIQYFIASDFR
jgi:hypothetical protein